MSEEPDPGLVFGRVARDYERWRPSYPDEAVDWVAQHCRGRRALEIGAGTGKATRSFVERGFDVTAADPDPAMVEVGSRQVPGADWVVADALGVVSDHGMDLIYGAQVWHWIPQEADSFLADKLSPGGVMAWMWNLPDEEEGRRLFGDIYSELLPDVGAVSERRRQRRDTRLWRDRLAEVTDQVEVFEHSWPRLMTGEQYVGMSGTFSDHVMLSDRERGALMEALEERIASLGGEIEVSYVTRVLLGYRAETPRSGA